MDDPKQRKPKIDLARELLGWSPEVSLAGGAGAHDQAVGCRAARRWRWLTDRVGAGVRPWAGASGRAGGPSSCRASAPSARLRCCEQRDGTTPVGNLRAVRLAPLRPAQRRSPVRPAGPRQRPGDGSALSVASATRGALRPRHPPQAPAGAVVAAAHVHGLAGGAGGVAARARLRRRGAGDLHGAGAQGSRARRRAERRRATKRPSASSCRSPIC